MKFNSDPIAIIGLGCRFPQADDSDAFWENIIAARTSFQDVPADRWNHQTFYSDNQRDLDKSWAARGSFIDSYREFAALHYGIAPRRLEVMDPQQRLLIEATRWAIQDAGYETKDFARTRTGVYVGVSISEFQFIVQARVTAMQMAGGDFGAAAGSAELREALLDLTANVAPMRAFTLSGSLTALAAASVAQTFDLGGPAYTIDSACASASVAVHDAVLQLRAGKIDAAVAGGAYLNLNPGNLVAFTKIGAISRSGACRPFDSRADGFVQSDGVGMVLLKRLDDAVAANDRIHAVILGSGCNNDGRGEGPMTPRVSGQMRALHGAYEDAGASPSSVSYFEAHGTATSIGDPVEVEALGRVLSEAGVTREAPALIGSVKGNIGHAMSAAGIAGLVKAIKVVEHRTAPPQAGFESPNEELGLDRWPLEVPRSASLLQARAGGPLRVGVSSFGFGGTNSHLVLQEPPVRVRRKAVSRPMSVDLDASHQRTTNPHSDLLQSATEVATSDASALDPEALVITAPTSALLAVHLAQLADHVERGPARDRSLADLAYTLNARRRRERVRAVIGARTPAELIANLRAGAAALQSSDGRLPLSVSPHVVIHDSGEPDAPRPKVCFLFPGQGAQRVGLLGAVRRRFPAFATALADYESSVSDVLPRPLSSYVYPGDSAREELEALEDQLKATEVCQPAMAALGLSMAHLLSELGVKADVSLGHSLGEFAALANARVLEPGAAVRLVALRGAAMHALNLADPGTMAAVTTDADTVRRIVDSIEGVWVANVNHPRQVSISGTTAGVRAATAALQAQKIEVHPLQVSHAFHTPLLEGVAETAASLLDNLELSAPQHVVASCIGERAHSDDLAAIRRVIIDHATAPVEFVRGLEQAHEAGATIFVQCGAGSVLTTFARATLGARGSYVTLSPREDDGGYEMMRGLCALDALGVAVNFEQAYAGQDRRVVTLPETPLVRDSYWPIKDQPQPKPELTTPLPDPKRQRVAALPTAAIQPATPTAPAREGLLELFTRQAELLRAHADVIAAQNRVLLGDGAAPADLGAMEQRVTALLAEPTARAPTVAVKAVTPAATPPSTETETEDLRPARSAAPTADVNDRVLEIIAKVSAFPRGSLRGEQKLVDELGFDSLMVADLGGALESEYPTLGGLPPSLFSLTTTVGDLVDHVRKTVSAPAKTEPVAEAPVTPVVRYRVAAVEQSRPALAEHDPTGETWLVTEDDSPLASEIGAALKVRGAKLVRVRFSDDGVAAPSKIAFGTINLWPRAFVEGLPAALTEAGIKVDGFIHAGSLDAGARDLLGPVELLHPLAANLAPKRFATVSTLGGRLGLEPGRALSQHLSQAGLTGYTKALARERPTDLIRHLDVDPEALPAENATFIVEELLGGDRTAEVGFDGQRRVAELVPAPLGGRSRKIEPTDVVLVTGGSGEIGARVAKWAARQKPKAVLLLGRRAADPTLRGLLSELSDLGTVAEYVRADLSDANTAAIQLDHAAKLHGPITVVLHAAGLIEDAPATKKSAESLHRVMSAKLSGVQAIFRSCTGLRDLVLFSSWAGRFGNAGQTDYAAANAALDLFAVAETDRRVVSIAWPPWASTAMVRSIPETIRRAMRTEGVTFLEDEEGLAVLDAVFAEGASGLEVAGRELPSREISALHTEKFNLERHAYLEDHRLKGRAVVPLASMTDLVASTFTQATGAVGAIVVSNLELVRGVMGGDTARVSIAGRRRGAAAQGRIEVRAGSEGGLERAPVAYRAEVAIEPRAPTAPSGELKGDARTAQLSLEDFYTKHTFHGPRFRGIEKVERMTSQGVTGVVRTSDVSKWIPSAHREGWAVDPLVLDGAFQLAAYWLASTAGRVGFPTGFDRLVLVRPFGQGPVHATVRLEKLQSDTFSGHVLLTDARGAPFAWVENVRGRFAEVLDAAESPAPKQNGTKNGVVDVPKETYDFASFPEIELLDQRFQMAELIGLRNPYFHMHAGTAKDTSVVDGVEMLNFSSYNYLGFSGHPEVVSAAQAAIEMYGTSVSASRVASGERPLHRDLEKGIADHVGVDDSIVYVSGHATNVTTIGHLFDRNDLIIHDSLIHDSILQGIHLSGSTRRPYAHGDLDALERLLSQVRKSYRRVLICAEGIYSMDGDICDLPRLIELKKRFKALLLIDEAHSIGVLGPSGRGIAHHFPGLDPRDVDLWMGTLSKSFASCGGYIAGSAPLVRYLKYTAPGFVYSAGITPPNAAAALKSLELMHRQPEVVERLRQRSKFFLDYARERGVDTGLAVGAAVVPAIVGNSMDCMRLSAALAGRRINVQPIVYPAVEDDAARLRFFISALHSEEQLRHTVDVMVEELARIRAGDGTSTSANA